MQSVALVHDYLNQYGGAERVVADMLRIWPQAPLYTTLYRPESTWPEFRDADVRTTFLDRAPLDQRFKLLAPLIPAALRSMPVLEQDLVISSSSGWAHGVRTAEHSLHVVYCYAPARWIYRHDSYHRLPVARTITAPGRSILRRWDFRAARRADAYISIAQNVRDRVRQAYGIQSRVVHPPVDVARFRPSAPGERYLIVSRLLSYKRVDIVVEAATRAGLPLDVVGTGPDLQRLQSLAGPSVRFLGRIEDDEVTSLYENCRAFFFPGVEDFGITPVEANAAGKPVIAFADGGALETLVEDRTAVFFREQTADAVVDAVRRLEHIDFDPARAAANAARFSPDAFRESLIEAIEHAHSVKTALRGLPKAAKRSRHDLMDVVYGEV
jgi:glycosyltransferase involved in cell wall biosynthesis